MFFLGGISGYKIGSWGETVINQINSIGQIHFINLAERIYWNWKRYPIVGYFSFSEPNVLVNDVEMIRNILIKDFDHFQDRYCNCDAWIWTKIKHGAICTFIGDQWTWIPLYLQTRCLLKFWLLWAERSGGKWEVLFHLFSPVGNSKLWEEWCRRYVGIINIREGISCNTFTFFIMICESYLWL